MPVVNQYTTEIMLDLLNQLVCAPDNQNTYTQDNLITLLNDVLASMILPQFVEVKAEYFIVSEEFQVDSSTEYLEIPYKAIGMCVRDVYWIIPGAGPSNVYRLSLIQPEAIGNEPYLGVPGNIFGGAGTQYFIEGNRIVFWPQLNQNGTIRIKYARKPNTLTSTANSGKIVAIDVNSNIVSLDTAPDVDSWDTGTFLDAIQPTQPFNFADENIEIISRAGLDFEFPPEVISNLSVGDYLTDTGFSIFLQYLPTEAQNLLVQAAAMKLLSGLGDTENYKIAVNNYENQKNMLFDLIKPRVSGQPKIIPRQKSSWMGGNGLNRFFNGT